MVIFIKKLVKKNIDDWNNCLKYGDVDVNETLFEWIIFFIFKTLQMISNGQ